MLLPLLLLWTGRWAQGAGPWGPQRADGPLARGCSAESQSYKLEVPQSMPVQEGQCVLVTCRFFYPYKYSRTGSVSGYWFREGANTNTDSPVATNDPQKPVQEGTRDRFHLLLDPQTRNCSLQIRDARRGDSGSYFFRVEAGNVLWNYCAHPVSVEVTALTHTPGILIPGTLQPGRPSNLTCSVPWACEQGTPPIFSWTSAALSSLGPRTPRSSVLTLSPRPQDHGTNLTCQVMFPGAGVTVERTVQLNVTAVPIHQGWVQTEPPFSAGNHRTRATAGVVLGAIGGAGVTALLAVCLCVIVFVVKTLRKKAPRITEDMNDIDPATRPASLGHPPESQLQGSAEPWGSSGAPPASGEEEQLHYASLSFHPWKKSSTPIRIH
ncbi:Myeloid cell surface antigen CD33 [Heterocephalus glaber]|uniref:Myeloid cell surface antigen CD33 n=1 Tax=Heterocephalus glaber TaxID=10181 RepID=G5BR80_HETGA|nr:Myeloid cell surface antigen CD33 [Heterocephalus glaber]